MNQVINRLTGSEDRQTRTVLILGIVVWFLHQNLLYALASVSCVWSFFSFTVAGITGLQLVEIIISVIAVVLMLYMIYLPWRHWQRFQSARLSRNPHLLEETEENRGALVAFIAMMVNSFFLLFMLASFVPMLALSVCSQA